MNDERKRPNLLQVIGSVLASMFGVQSEKARARDFQHGKPSHYILTGLVAVTVFVLVIIGIVRLILHLTGA